MHQSSFASLKYPTVIAIVFRELDSQIGLADWTAEFNYVIYLLKYCGQPSSQSLQYT